MTNERQENLMNGLLRRALVPKGFRPRSADDEDAMLKALGHVEISVDKRERVLAKILGKQPFDLGRSSEPESRTETAAINEELAVMFREEGDISPEVQQRLSELERAASESFDQVDDIDDEEIQDGP